MYRIFWLSVATLWWRELIHFWRERSRVAGFIGSPLLFWLVIGSGFGNLAFFFPGALLLSVIFTAVFSTISVIEDRREGFLLAVLASPAPRCALVIGKVLGGASMAMLQGAVFFVFLPFTSLKAGLMSTLAALAVLFLVGLAFTSLGFWLAWKSKTPQGFHAIMNLVLMPLWMVSGALFSPDTAHQWMRALMTWNPMSYSLAALQRTISPTHAWSGPALGLSLAVTAAFGLALLTLSVYAVERQKGVSLTS